MYISFHRTKWMYKGIYVSSFSPFPDLNKTQDAHFQVHNFIHKVHHAVQCILPLSETLCFSPCPLKAHPPEYLPRIGQLTHARASTANPVSDHLCFQLPLSFTPTENIGVMCDVTKSPNWRATGEMFQTLQEQFFRWERWVSRLFIRTITYLTHWRKRGKLNKKRTSFPLKCFNSQNTNRENNVWDFASKLLLPFHHSILQVNLG